MTDQQILNFKNKLLSLFCEERFSLYYLLRSFERLAEGENHVVVSIPKSIFLKFNQPIKAKTGEISPTIIAYVDELIQLLPNNNDE